MGIPLLDEMPHTFTTKLILEAFCAAAFNFKKIKTRTAACSEILESVLKRMFCNVLFYI